MVEFILITLIVALLIALFIIFTPLLLVLLALGGILLIICGIFYFIEWLQIKLHIKHNCFECKNYHLRDVASYGDRCWYGCKQCNIEDTHSMNDNEMYRKCKHFEEKEEIYEK